MTDDRNAHLGRIALAPEIRADDVAELDLVEVLEFPAVDSAASDELPRFVAEHPDPEPVLAPVLELAVEELTRLLGRVDLGMERGDHAFVAMERVQVCEVALGQRAPDEAPGHDRAGV